VFPRVADGWAISTYTYFDDNAKMRMTKVAYIRSPVYRVAQKKVSHYQFFTKSY